MKTQKRHIIILLALITCLLGWGNNAWAVDWDYTKNTAGTTTVTLNTANNGNKFKVGSTTYDGIGTVTVSKGTLNIVLNTSGITMINGQIQVTGGTLNIYWGTNYASQSGSSLKRGRNNTGYLFNVTGGTLYIYGNSTKYISIHGDANNWTLDATNHTATFNTGTYAERAIMYISGGTLKLNRVSLACNWNNTGDGGALVFKNGPYTVDIQNSSISSCYAKNSGAVIDMNAGSQSSVTISNTTISGNFTYSAGSTTGGNIRTSGNTKCNLSMSDCEVTNNHSRGSGGVFHWNTGFGTLTLSSCTMKNNWTSGSGGALLLTGSASLSGCTFQSNSSSTHGGAIYVGTYSSSTYIANYNPNDGSVTLDANTKILSNTAGGNGGGICVDVNNISIAAGSGSGQSAYVVQNHTVNLNVNGATIQSNKASYGGGIYMTRSTTRYTTNINLNYGTIDNNTATNNGGGLYATTSASNDAIPVNVGSTSGTIIITKNKAVNGAGIYINNGNITLKSGNIGTSGNANACTTGSGGGLYITGARSVISIQGGNIQYNTASSGNGGGIYVASSSSTGTSITGSTKVQYNQAINGAGAFINSGNLTINGSSVSVNNNTATTSGGGVYVNGGTVSVTSATIGSNTAATHGGGIFVSSTGGAVTLSSATVSSNTATNGNGGGLYASKSVTVTSSTFTGNKAAPDASSNGGGGGIYATGSGTTVSIGGTSNAKSLFTSNQARLGGGVYATSNVTSITVGDATIGNSGVANTASQEGGGIYAAGPVTLNAGSVTQYNTAGTNGGGVYVTGSSSTVTVKGNVNNNTATNNGGGIYVNSSSSDGTTISNSAHVNNNSAKNGAGAFINSGKLTISDSGTQVNSNVASVNGGGLYVNGGTVGITSATVSSNTAATSGGGIYSNGGTVTLSSATLSSNTATGGNGGGVWASSTVNVNSSTLSGNKAPNNSNGKGGGIYAEGSSTNINITRTNSSSASSVLKGNQARLGGGVYASSVNLVQVDYGTIGASGEANTASADGGGIYAAGPVTLNTGSVVQCNTATNDGGGVYVDNGTFTMTAGTIGGNSATYANIANGNGGGVYVKGSSAKVVVSGGSISYNSAPSTSSNKGNGGGIYVESTGNDGTAISGTATLANNTAKQNGGGIYVANGTIAVSSTGGITSNQAQTGNGGGIYMGGGSCSVTAGAIGASGSANQAVNGGGIYATGGTISVSGGNVNYNTASTSGGGIYSNAGTVNVSSGNVNNNTATTDGGGIYTKGTVNFSNGNIKNNAATNGNGGGVYIYSTGILNVSGTAEVSANTVQSGWGGGVYQGGTMYADGSSFKVISNTRNGSKATSANNVYLPNGHTIEVGPNITTSVDLGIYTENIASVDNLIPVLTTEEDDSNNKLPVIYNAMLTGASNIHDDRRLHQPIYSGDDPTGHTLYFGFIEFDYEAYTEDFSNPIDSREKLYQFMCWVNGVNGYTDAHPGAAGNVTADIDASDFILWIPIGEANMIGDTDPYTGTFTGNGHVINGLGLTDELYSNYGLFGTTEGAAIDGVYVTNCEFEKNTAGAIGCIVGHMQGGSLTNSTCSGILTAAHADCIVGGLVGKLEKNGSANGTIHSSYAGTNQTGYQMGGLVGDLAEGCNLYNSFANVSFTAQSGNTAYMGGLVAVNQGHVENCYAHLRGNAPSGKFGYLAGNNTGTTDMGLYYSYAQDEPYVSSSGTQGNKVGLSTFTATATPYTYKHHDNQVAEASGNSFITNANGNLDRTGVKGLVRVLNNWVNQDAAHSSTYLPWMRTSASPINADYPIFYRANDVCACSPDNIALEYSNDFNSKFEKYITANSGTIYLYHSPSAEVTSTLSNNSGTPDLYIHEDVVMLHSSAIKAHVGITLDNTAGSIGATPSFGGSDNIDWHFFSSALADAPIGLVYGDQIQYEAYHYPTWQAYFNSANGYFPTNFNTSTPSASDYYVDWDLYAYFERCYHWINLKRNSSSHWLEDWPGVNIPYVNESIFTPGKGYMVALKDEGYLQGYGTLNTNSGENDDFLYIPVTYTPEISWTTREGHNLLGNPYQSYLDFDAFAGDEENATLWNAGRRPFYIIMDEDQADYVLYTVGQSPNESRASRFLHPHQGFMVDFDYSGDARFCNAMRTTSTTTTGENPVTWSGSFRGEASPCYPLVNLFATDSHGNRDMVTVELGRPDKGGVLKQDAWRTGTGSLSCHYEGEDYDLVFTQPGLEYASIRFACDEDGEYTMTWNTQNGEFSYLHLIDNITGSDIDCLSKSEYKFSARNSDYNSRFRLMFGYTGIEENGEDGPSTGSGADAAFAFIMNGELVVNGTGFMQLIDLNGRVLTSYNINDTQSMVTLPDIPAGIYVLRLITENGTRTQKIILD